MEVGIQIKYSVLCVYIHVTTAAGLQVHLRIELNRFTNFESSLITSPVNDRR